MQQPDYKMISLLLNGNQVAHAPAELHGLLAGQLCSGVAHPDPDEVGELIDYHGSLAPVVVKLLERLSAETAGQLSHLDYHFQPLLPDDTTALHERVTALGLWCDGFTVGFASGFLRPESDLGPEAREILNDFGQLAMMSEDEEEDALDEQSEVDYMELVEYVRMAAITLYQLLATPVAARPAGTDDDTLH